MASLCNLVLVLSAVALVSSAPHHHHHYEKTVYLGGGGVGHSDAAVAGGGGLSFSASLGGAGAAKHEVVSEKVVDVELPPAPEVKAHKTVIERTVIPQYVEKTVRVPTYVEKTIRVPSYVEKKVKVPVESAIVEKTISHEHVPVDATKTIAVQKDVGYVGQREARVGYGAAQGQGGFFVGGGGGAGAGGYGAGHGSGFFDSIFNIPIQTLGAVNGLLNGLSGGGHVSAGVSKGYSTY